MALTTREMFDLTHEQYHLQLLAAKDYLDHVVTWVHMMEYTHITQFFLGNEVVVTGGYALHSEQDMIELVDILTECRCAALVLNIGRYLHAVPQSIIDYCEKVHLPLFTMPWQMYITEFVRDCCSLINQSSQDEAQLARAVTSIVFSPQEAGTYRKQLDERFQEEQGFIMLAIRGDHPTLERNVVEHRSILRLHTALTPYTFSYLIFRYQKRFLILMNHRNLTLAEDAAHRILDAIRTAIPNLPIRIGISDPVDSYQHLTDCFHGAISAGRRASLQRQEIVRFCDMGFYRLLYSVPDDALLSRYYHDMMDTLLQYDAKNNSSYTETLFRYLLSDGSLQTVASAMFTHRNTVHYRMGKIRELLNNDLSTQAQRLPYLLAYHTGVILREFPDLEHED